MRERFREAWQNSEKVLVVIELGILLSTLFAGYSFMEFSDTMEEEGCRYFYETHVPGFEYSESGEFMNTSEYEEATERSREFYGKGLEE